jgi:hypothetical protein
MTDISDSFLTSLNGLVSIEDVKIDESIMTHKKRYRKVVSIEEMESPSRILSLYGSCDNILPEDLLVLSRRRQRRNGKLKWSNPVWTPARYLTRYDFVGYPVDEPGRNNISSVHAGAYYLAGHLYASNNSNEFFIPKKEVKNEILSSVINALLEQEYAVEFQDRYIILWKELNDVMDSIKTGEIHTASMEAQTAFWSGWLSRDSAVDKKTVLTIGRIGRSVSRQGVNIFQWTFADSIFFSVSSIHKSDLKRQIYEFGFIWTRVRKNINNNKILSFVKIQTDEDNSFILNGFACS